MVEINLYDRMITSASRTHSNNNNPWIPERFSHVDLKIADTTAPLEFFVKNGYYIVAGKIFRHKMYAMQAASKLGIRPDQVVWVFNDKFYSALDWTQPSRIPLTTLYKIRAQQLRDKYDYLIDRKSTRLNSSHVSESRMPSSA